MTETDFLYEQLRTAAKQYEAQVEPIIARIAHIRSAEVPSVLVDVRPFDQSTAHQVMQQALETLQNWLELDGSHIDHKLVIRDTRDTIAALKQALHEIR